jgi:predicted unusual protein kinase regulating ubiquinone biosynthesis (AarF/ABC1/UbiB family)/DNA-binding XRE family transcriptional regulator
MPRTVTKSNRVEEASRLRHLRNLLGLSQRQMAKEFGVAHGAICFWEKGERTIPGSVLKLIALYEDNLGMVGSTKRSDFSGLKSSWLSRTWQCTKTSAVVAGTLASSNLKQMLASNARAAQIKAATEEAIGLKLAESLGELKGLMMKLGQTASYMDFALPESTRKWLVTLQSNAVSIHPSIIEKVIETELGDSPNRIFQSWSRVPIAAASIGQIHRAQLADGTQVAVKVQYPGIRESISVDLKSASLVGALYPLLFQGVEKSKLLEELSERLLEECDYEQEGKNISAFREIFGEAEHITIPNYFSEFSTARVLTVEYVDGMDFYEFAEQATQGERNQAAETIYRMAFESIFSHRIFNCDPHPGNYLFSEKRVTFLDFGGVKRFDANLISTWKKISRALLEQNKPNFNRALTKMGFVPFPAQFDFEYHYKLTAALYEPWLEDKKFRFTPHFIKHLWRMFMTDNPNKYVVNLPPDTLATGRIFFGLYSVLAHLGAEINCRPIILDLLYSPDEIRPEPFSI